MVALYGNEFIVEGENRIPITKEVDVVVCGVGPAGFGAVIAAAKGGAKTLGIERYAFMGGGLTGFLVDRFPAHMLVPIPEYGLTKPLSSGVFIEWYDRLAKLGGALPRSDLEKDRRKIAGMIYADPELMKFLMQEMLEESGAEVLLHTMVVDTVVENNVIRGVIIENKSGRQAILAKVVIDCTGDGDVFAAAGAPFEQTFASTQNLTRTSRAMPITLEWRLANIDAVKAVTLVGTKKLQEMIDKATERGEISDIGPDFILGYNVNSRKLRIETPRQPWRPGEVPMQYAISADSTNVMDLTTAEISAREKILTFLNWVRKNVPGYEEAYVSFSGAQMGLRESRHVVGEYWLTGDGDINRARKHKDVVVRVFRGSLYIRGKDGSPEVVKTLSEEPQGPLFDIPYGCFVPLKIDGLLVAGRCISMDHVANLCLEPREESTCMVMGDVVGTASAMCIEQKINPRNLNVKKLQKNLEKRGFNLYEGKSKSLYEWQGSHNV